MKGGFILPIVLIAMAIMIVIIASLVLLGVREAYDVTQDRFRKKALAVAEAGLARAQTYIQRNWNTLIDKGIPSEFRGTTVFNHLEDQYKIWISTTVESYGSAVIATISGRVSRGNSTHIKTIQVKYSRSEIEEAINVGTLISWRQNMIIHWAPAISYGNMILLGGQVSTYWPRRFSKGYINPWDMSSNPPNEDTIKNYYAFQTYLEKPTIDLEYYKEKAKNTRLIEAAISNWNSLSAAQKRAISQYQHSDKNYTGNQRPQYAGTGYFPAYRAEETVELHKYFELFYSSDIVISSRNAVIYIETKSDPENTTLKIDNAGNRKIFIGVEAIVNLGNVHYHADGIDNYTVRVPTNAWREYTAGTVLTPTTPDSSAADQYPGDGGYRIVKPFFTIKAHQGGGGSHSNDSCQITGLNGIKGTAFHGFLYTLRFKCSAGNQALVGSVFIDKGEEDDTGEAQMNTIAVFYDQEIGKAIRYKSANLKLMSYNELLPIW
ncbi:MAG: hypothetical protein NZ870_02120 [bacterium]|nr:hypothetical protein [bacterium]